MVQLENLASTLSGILVNRLSVSTLEWRVLGQEQDGCLLVSWLLKENEQSSKSFTCVGLYQRNKRHLEVLYQFEDQVNIVQASVNSSRTVLLFVTKNPIQDVSVVEKECCAEEKKEKLEIYEAHLIQLRNSNLEESGNQHQNLPSKPLHLGIERSSQTVVQFLYRSKDQPGDVDRFLVLIHHESVSLYQYQAVFDPENDKELTMQSIGSVECVVRSFTWAQWDPIHQCLFYIHYRKPAARLVEDDDVDLRDSFPSTETGRRQESELSPTLSGLQFHDSMPHETVLNIPLNLPLLPNAMGSICSLYEDDPIPLRVHDCSLDLTVVSDPKGLVCICHHYLYQPAGSQAEREKSDKGPGDTVFFAYSVTLLHHGCVLHCVIPGIPWDVARRMRPSFSLYGDHHMLVHANELFTHLLDIGLEHEPCCHILLDKDAFTIPVSETAWLVPLLPTNKEFSSLNPKPLVTMLDMSTLDIVPISIASAHLLCAFRGGPHGPPASGHRKKPYLLPNQLSILHYVLVHLGDNELLLKLLSCIASQCMDVGSSRLLQEILVGGAYAAARKNLPPDAASLLPLLPLTVALPGLHQEIKMNNSTLTLSQETLWNTAMMLLSPQQRLVPYRSDMWTRLYESLSASQQRATDTTCTTDSRSSARFRPSHVADKLMVSLLCYQPEALSRCTTPLSPGGNFAGSGASFSDIVAITNANRKTGGLDFLPFQESESCTASKQEHVISVNLRELSVHLLKHALRGQSPLHVHGVATRYVAAQLDMSRSLCRQLCLAAKVDPRHEKERGFSLIDSLDDARRRLLFWLLERFLLATETLAFPLPQGFTSFFSFLGYRTLPFSSFMQFSHSSVFELQVDVMKAIMSDIPDTPEGCSRKLRLLQLLPRSRAKRILNAWPHPSSLMVRAREHALYILSGVEGTRGSRSRSSKPRQEHLRPYQALVNRGLTAFPSQDRLSPLDTFLDLLTAKASLAELDFGLLIEATIASTQEITL